MLGIELYRASFARCLFLLPKKKGNSCLTKNAELRLICKVADIIERLPERSWDFKYQYGYRNDSLADLMGISEDEVESAINRVHLLIAATLLLTNSRPMGENILKCAVTIVMHRRIDDMLEMNDTVEECVTKPFDVFMQKLREV